MTVRDIAYVEIYARDQMSTVNYFVSAMGFTRVAESVEPGRSSVLLRQGSAQVVITAGPGVANFINKHGDGVADIGLTCDDVAETAGRARAVGTALIPSPRNVTVLPGFGDVTHTLLPHTPHPGTRAPHGRTWIPTPGQHGPATRRIQNLDHLAVCVAGGSLNLYADYYQEVFGLTRYSSEYVTLGGQAMDSIVVRSASGRVTLTLVAPDPGKEPGQLDDFLERNGGEAVQHLAFLVDDIVSAVEVFRERGVEFLNTPDTYYDMLAERLESMRDQMAELRKAQVLADQDEWGDLLQVFTRSPHPRNTLFYELIQRRGSRGFGSANIRALYEAVERERTTSE
ncbi:4-hydroxyphenylpyruvate dioxygenase [Nonomuraea endophytica]|uniref:4-hydroxyphenylpyruvate dioxygenase n=1 Tax=Nonomuraea endophytica TaxID=714136 RepID=UPI0037CC34F8